MENKSRITISNVLKLMFIALLLVCVCTMPEAHSENYLHYAIVGGFSPMLWGCGEENMSGFKNRLLFIPECSVKTVPELAPKSEVTTDDDLIFAKGSFVFIDNSLKPTVIYATPRTAKYGAEGQGEADGKSFKQNVEYFFPGSPKQVHIHNRKIANTPGYYVMEDFDGNQYLIGQPGLPAITTPKFDGGQNMTDRRGTTYTIECDAKSTAIFLEAPIDIDKLLADAKAEIANPNG
ncbi:MAG: hypothetical protein LBJ72_11935 [Dysgonamonadaceae bacterium]|jgi:hypothetical protein|nr:hypothetical protein [Dysgonamonadaceae bacterium]